MTVFALFRKLLWLLVTRRVRPNDLVVREFGGEGGFVNVVYIDEGWELPEHPCCLCKRCDCVCQCVHHRTFSREGTAAKKRLVRLD